MNALEKAARPNVDVAGWAKQLTRRAELNQGMRVQANGELAAQQKKGQR